MRELVGHGVEGEFSRMDSPRFGLCYEMASGLVGSGTESLAIEAQSIAALKSLN